MLLALCIIWFSVVDHGAECGYLMLATVQNINLCCGHGPQCGSVLLSMVHNVVLCCCLWTTMWFYVADHGAKYFVLCFWPWCRIWCCVKSQPQRRIFLNIKQFMAMGQSTETCSVLRTTDQILTLQWWANEKNHTKLILKSAKS